MSAGPRHRAQAAAATAPRPARHPGAPALPCYPTRPLPMIRYRIELADPNAHRFRVTLTIAEPAAGQRLSLPVWIPGSYLVREFARHLSGLVATQGGRPIPLAQLDKATWQAACAAGEPLEVACDVHAFDTSVRAAFLDGQRGFFNGTSLCLRAEGHEHTPHRIELAGGPAGWKTVNASLAGWQVATAMRAVAVDADGWGSYESADYDELVDHPFELGLFWRGRFTAHGVPHEYIVAGALPDFDGARLLADAQRICEAQIAFWHRADGPAAEPAPFERYVFLHNLVDDGHGGLEHRASTALISPRRDMPRRGGAGLVGAIGGANGGANSGADGNANVGANAGANVGANGGANVEANPGAATAAADTPDGQVNLLGLISHEYFHAWNVKRLRPAEFARYDYTRENYTELLWFFEGFTSYYDDAFLLRAGLIDAPRYLKLVARTLSGVLAAPGRRVQSVAQSSFDSWVKYYRADENTPNATISYYTKGALVALALDLTLRAEGRGTLDDVMRALWAASRGGPIDEAAIAAALQRIGGRSYADELAAWVHGTDDLPLPALFARFGIELKAEPATLAQRLGVRVSESALTGIRLSHVLAGGAAQAAGLAPGDELLAVDGWRVRRLDDALRLLTPGVAAPLLVARDQRVLTCSLRLPEPAAGAAAGATSHGLADAPAAPVAALRKAWLSA